MKALYSLILASGTKEALFAALWLALDEEPGTFADVDFATLRATAARFGVALSESQIRKRVKELEKLDVLAVAPRRERGRFDLFVYQPAPNRFNVDATAPKPEPATPLFDAAFGKGVESFVGDRAAPGPSFRSNSSSAPVGRSSTRSTSTFVFFVAVFAGFFAVVFLTTAFFVALFVAFFATVFLTFFPFLSSSLASVIVVFPLRRVVILTRRSRSRARFQKSRGKIPKSEKNPFAPPYSAPARGQNVRSGPVDRPGKLESRPEELKRKSIIKE